MMFIVKEQKLKLFYSSIFKLVALTLIVGFIVRIVLLFNEKTEINFSVLEWSRIFFLGAVNDICIGIIASIFMWLYLIFLSNKKYNKPWGYIILGFIIICLCYVSCFNTIFHEYGSVLPKIVRYFFIYKAISFGLRLFIPSIRKYWSFAIYTILIFTYTINMLLFNAVGEYLFWDEFGVRYNFIAVDYLIYTNEVIGNIIESYPIIPLCTLLIVISATIAYFLTKNTKRYFENYLPLKYKLVVCTVFLILVSISCAIINFNVRFQNSENVYVNELQANSTFKFYTAFINSKLEYINFYVTLPKEEAISIINKEYDSQDIENLKIIKDSLPEIHRNIVLITLESMSASFLQHFGNTDNLTPNLDKLMSESLTFTNLYATGNRTVRGLEAVTLSRPPGAGESIVKQPNNSGLFSTCKILKERGYTVQYLYGGDSYFDNMRVFFGGNGYEVIDKSKFSKEEITFKNIWGVCDEDMFNKALKVFNKNAEMGKPFFGHIMTVSNHRPFTYPDGKIDISPNSKSREGGVKYTDYALGNFIKNARKEPWFNNTVFVIVADHCASSAGKTELPLENYHIPALIYAPEFIESKHEDRLVSQIDIMPTLFGLLNFSYNSHFYGKDIYSENYRPRAFVATYQNLGYWEDNTLTILSPVRKIEQFQVNPKGRYIFDLELTNKIDSIYAKIAIANYQVSSY